MTTWFAFRGNQLLVRTNGGPATLPHDLQGAAASQPLTVASFDGEPCLAAALPDEFQPPEGMALEGLRPLHGRLDPHLWRLAGRAFQLVDWDRTHRFCGRCGTPTEMDAEEGARRCPRCGQMHFPRIAPAIIVLVRRGNQMLLARSHHFPPEWYSTLAGFVEPGETLEEAVAREVLEESGIAVTNIRYFGSQPWPFPHSLMVGFTADYVGGEIVLQEKELEAAGWFAADKLPGLPPAYSIARRLIDSFIQEQQEGRS